MNIESPTIIAKTSETVSWSQLTIVLKRLWRQYCKDLLTKMTNGGDSIAGDAIFFEKKVDYIFDYVFIKDDVELMDYQVCATSDSVSKIARLLNFFDTELDDLLVDSSHVTRSTASNANIEEYLCGNVSLDGGALFDSVLKNMESFVCDLFSKSNAQRQRVITANAKCTQAHARFLLQHIVKPSSMYSKSTSRSCALASRGKPWACDYSYAIVDKISEDYKQMLSQFCECSCGYKDRICFELDRANELLFDLHKKSAKPDIGNIKYEPKCSCYSNAESSHDVYVSSLESFSEWIDDFSKQCFYYFRRYRRKDVGENNDNRNNDDDDDDDGALVSNDDDKITVALSKTDTLDVLSQLPEKYNYTNNVYIQTFDWYYSKNEHLCLNRDNLNALYGLLSPICTGCGSLFSVEVTDGYAMVSKKRKRSDYDQHSRVIDIASDFYATTEEVSRNTVSVVRSLFDRLVEILRSISDGLRKFKHFENAVGSTAILNSESSLSFDATCKTDMLTSLKNMLEIFEKSDSRYFDDIRTEISRLTTLLDGKDVQNSATDIEGEYPQDSDFTRTVLVVHCFFFVRALLLHGSVPFGGDVVIFRDPSITEADDVTRGDNAPNQMLRSIAFGEKNVASYVKELSFWASKIIQNLNNFTNRVRSRILCNAKVCLDYYSNILRGFENNPTAISVVSENIIHGNMFFNTTPPEQFEHFKNMIKESSRNERVERIFKKMRRSYDTRGGDAIAVCQPPDQQHQRFAESQKIDKDDDDDDDGDDMLDDTRRIVKKRCVASGDFVDVTTTMTVEEPPEYVDIATTVRPIDVDLDVTPDSDRAFLKFATRWRMDLNFQLLILRTYLFMKTIITRGRIACEKQWVFDCLNPEDLSKSAQFMEKYGYMVVKAIDYDKIRSDFDGLEKDLPVGVNGSGRIVIQSTGRGIDNRVGVYYMWNVWF